MSEIESDEIPYELIQKNKLKVAFYCKACDTPLNDFKDSHRLPDGSPDDLCNYCKTAIKESSRTRLKPYAFEDLYETSLFKYLSDD